MPMVTAAANTPRAGDVQALEAPVSQDSCNPHNNHMK